MVVLSGYPSELYDRLYGDWHREEREALAENAAKRTEVLWFNVAATAALDGQTLFAAPTPEVA
jgi:DNA adenine methylase